MDEKLNIVVLLGTAREGRQSEKIAHFMQDELNKAGFAASLVDVRDFTVGVTTPPWASSEKFASWKKTMSEADGLVIVSPEYNHGYPGELKIMLDSLMNEYAYKPVGICGVSSGGFGGVRVVEQLRLVTINFQMTPLKNTMQFSNVESFDSAKYDEALKKFCDELRFVGQALKSVR